jgi:magnesium transporter
VFAIVDTIVVGYATIVDRFEAFYDDAAEMVFGREQVEEGHHRRKFETRRSLDRFSRTVDSLAEAVGGIADHDLDYYGPVSAPYLTDVRADLRGLVVELDGMSELVGQLLDADLLLRDHRQNVVMKKVTSWAAVIAVPTLVTGYYGMNVPFPGEAEAWGVVASTGLALGCSIGLYVLFTKKRWL